MNCIKRALVCVVSATSVMFVTATPEVSNVTMTQRTGSRLVTITYKLTEDAVVTLDVLTNATPNAATGWASIGGKAICNAQGAVWRKVTSADADGSGNYTITWRPDNSWTDEFGNGFKIADGCAKAVVTAYALDNTPDYMVVDISASAQQNTQRYYPAVDFLPGGLLDNPDYRTTLIVMRKIMAKDVTWTMGSVAEVGRNSTLEATHRVTLTNNYYIGVFEVTQTQWQQVTGYNPAFFTANGTMRPVDQVTNSDIRYGKGTATSCAASTGGVYPDPPYGESFLGLLRTRTGIDFDLPGEAQWEFAARAGNGEGHWGDASLMQGTDKDANFDLHGRYLNNPSSNSSSSPAATTAPEVGGTAIVGSYRPNDWGLYDMSGNVREWCLDKFENDITGLNGAVDTSTSAQYVVERGGDWNNVAVYCRPAFRNANGWWSRSKKHGFRVVCTAGLQ